MAPQDQENGDRVQLTKRQFIGATVGAGVLGTLSTPAAAGGDGGDGGDGDDGDGGASGGAPDETHTVTLVTGETVHVEEYRDVELDEDGTEEDVLQRTYSVDADDPTAVDVIEEEDGTFIIPEYVDTSVFARHLFNVDFLIEQGYTDEEWDHTPVFVREGAGPSAMAAGGRTYTSTDAIAFDIPKPTGEAGVQAMSESAFSDPDVERVFLNTQDEIFLDTNTGPIQAPDARDQFDLSGDGVVVGIVDTGIDDTHPDLEGRVVDEVDFSDEDEPGVDNNGHGTSVAGVVGGEGVEDEDVVGIAPDVEFVDAKAFPEGGVTTREQVLQAVEWAIDDADPQPDVLNLSLGGPIVEEDDPVVEACNRAAEEEGIFVAVSAGNENSAFFPSYGNITNPGQAESVTTVGATDRAFDGEPDDPVLAFFSSWGPTPFDQRLKPEIVAPGVEITTAASDDQELPGEFPYRDISGTSFSAPMIAGLAGLLFELDDREGLGLDPFVMEDHMVTTADPIAEITENDPYQQGSGEVRMADAIGTDIVVEDAVTNLGIVNEPGEAEVPLTVRNLSDEEVTLDVEATAYDIEEGEENEDVLTGPGEVTVPADDTAEVVVNADLEFGRWGGAVTLDDGDTSYRALVGVAVGVQVEVEILLNEDSNLETAAGQNAFAWSHDGEISQLGEFGADNVFRFLQFREEATYDFWGLDELEPQEGTDQTFSGPPVLAVRTEVDVDADTGVIELDANDTYPREFDLDALPDDGPFVDEDSDFQLFFPPANGRFSRGFIGGFDIFSAYYSPIDEDDLTNLAIAILFAPEDQIPTEPDFPDATQAETVYHPVDSSLSHPEGGEVIDPDLARLDLEYFFPPGVDDFEPEPANMAPSYFFADPENFPVFFVITFVQDARNDEQTWYLTDDAEYTYSWRDGSVFDRDTETRYEFLEGGSLGGIVPEAGSEVESTLGYQPIPPTMTEWERDDDTLSLEVAPYADFDDVRFSNYAFNFADQNLLEVFVNGEFIGDLEYLTSHQPVNILGLEDGDTLQVVNTSNTLDTADLYEDVEGPTAELIHETTLGGRTDTPPQLTAFTIPGLSRDNELNSSVATAVVELEESDPRGRSGLAEFDAFYGTAADVDSVTEPADWDAAEVLYEDDGTYAIRFDATDKIDERLAFALSATDRDDNLTAASSIGVCPVMEWATEGKTMRFAGSGRGGPGGSGDIRVRLQDTTADDVDVGSVRFGTPETVYDDEGADVVDYQELGGNRLELSFDVEGSGLPEDADIKTIPANARGRFAPDYDEVMPVTVTGDTATGDRFAAAHVVLVDY